jgi:hypothetical protein
MDKHFAAHWDGGHVKFFSTASLSKVRREPISFSSRRSIPAFAKSMICVVEAGPLVANSAQHVGARQATGRQRSRHALLAAASLYGDAFKDCRTTRLA